MPADVARALEIDGPPLDAQAIVLGAGCREGAPPVPVPHPTAPAVVWEGSVQGDGTGPQPEYYVRLYADGTAHCQCPAFYFRGTLRRNNAFVCKHVQRARLRVEQMP
jgi:hypothetical protein